MVRIGADTMGFDRSITGVLTQLGRMDSVAAAAGLAIAAAIAGVVAYGTNAVGAWAEVETKMNEVFTLLPGISEEAMGAMTDDVIALSRETGKTATEIIPALYQAISAGVPADNVFDFLRVSNALAVGGVAELEDSVRLLAGSVNAYGSEVLTYEAASDALFTAVKLGVTTIPELATAIGRVTPISADLGISFDHVAAALATLTTVFPSTAEAATGLRSMLAELGKDGSMAFGHFAEATGTTFPEFIAAGGTIEEALTHMGDYADTNGLRMNNLFGSIEAGTAASVLAGDEGARKLGIAMDAMGEKAGATQAAFDTMATGYEHNMGRLKAGFDTMKLEVGEALAPMFQDAVTTITDTILPALSAGVIALYTGITAFVADVRAEWTKFQTDTDGVYATIRTTIEAFGIAIGAVFDVLVAAWDNVLKPAWDAMEPLATAVFGAVGDIITLALGTVTGLLTALAALLNGDFSGAWTAMQGVVVGVWETMESVATRVWEGIQGVVENTMDGAITAVTNAWNTIDSTTQSVIAGVQTWLETTWDGIVATATEKWEDLKAAVMTPITDLKTALEGTWATITAVLFGMWGSITATAGAKWTELKDVVMAPVNDLVTAVEGALDGVVEFMRTAGANLIGALTDGISSRLADARSAIEGVGANIASWFRGILGIDSPSRVFLEFGQNVMAGLIDGITSRLANARSSIESVGANIASWFRGVLGIDSPSTVFHEIGVYAMAGFTNGLEEGQAFALSSTRTFLGRLTAEWAAHAQTLQGFFDGTYKPMFGSMIGDVVTGMNRMAERSVEAFEAMSEGMDVEAQKTISNLIRLEEGVDDATKEMLQTWAGYADHFIALLDKHNGNVLKALGDLLLGMIQGALMELAIANLVEIGKAYIKAPLTFGATLAALGPITAAYAAGAAALAALRSRIAFADGGIVTGPVHALVGEAGPEAIIPLDRLDRMMRDMTGGGGEQTIIVELDGRAIMRSVAPRLVSDLRLRTGIAP